MNLFDEQCNKFKDILKQKMLDFRAKHNRLPKLTTLLDNNDDIYTEDTEYINDTLTPLYDSIFKELNLELWKYQIAIIDDIIEELKPDNSRTMMIAPTGSGKTKMVFVSMAKMISNKPMLYVFVSPLLSINKQCLNDDHILTNPNFNTSKNKNTFTKIEFNSKNNKYETAYKKAIKNKSNIIISTTYQSLKNVFKVLKNTTKRIDLLILDECHMINRKYHYPTYFNSLLGIEGKEITNEISNLDKQDNKDDNINIKKEDAYALFFSDKVNKRLFITATPYNHQRESNHMYGGCIESVKVGDLIREGYLANVETFIAKVSNEDPDTEQPDTATSIIKFAIKERRLRLCIFVNTINNAEILKKCIMESSDYKDFAGNSDNPNLKIVEPILYKGNDEFKKVEKRFIKYSKDTDTNKDVFNKDEIRILISCKKLSMGVDIPCIDSIIFADPRMNKADISQCIGRGLRRFEMYNGVKVCKILLLNYSTAKDTDTDTDSDGKITNGKNAMICEYLDYLKGNRIVNDIIAKINNKEGSPQPGKIKYCKCANNSKHCLNCKLEPVKMDIYDGSLEIDIEYYEEYSSFIRDNMDKPDKTIIGDSLHNYQIAKDEYNKLKHLCKTHNIKSIDEYLKLIATFINDKINEITNPVKYFDIKIPKGYNAIWKCWFELFEIDYSLMPKTIEAYKTKITKLALDTIPKYKKYCETYNDLPDNPKLLYDTKDLQLIIKELFD